MISDDEAASNDSTEVQLTKSPKKKRTPHKQKFRAAWKEVPAFYWLEEVPGNPYQARCIIDGKTFNAKHEALLQHATSQDHLKAIGLDDVSPATDFISPKRNESTFERERANTELQVVAIAGSLNLPYKKIPELVQRIRYIHRKVPNSPIHSIKLGKTKARDLAVNVIAVAEQQRLVELLKDSFFSICVDESTDIGKSKSLVISIRVYNPDSGIVEDWLWELISLFKPGSVAKATAKVIRDAIVDSITSRQISIKNIMACSFDGCSTMVGQWNGLKALLNEDIPGIVTIRCAAHVTNLCLKHSLCELPSEIINLVKDIYNILNSANKAYSFHELQNDLYCFSLQVLKLALTRWLSLERCINRIKKLWDALLAFTERLSNQKGDEKQKLKAKKIFELMNKIETKCYVLLLSRVLGELNLLNVFFQRKETVIHLASERIKKTFKTIAKYIINKEYIDTTEIHDVDLLDDRQYLKYEDFDFGEELSHMLRENVSQVENFCKDAFNFTLSILLYLQQMLKDLQQNIFDLVECLKPANAISIKYHLQNPRVFNKLLALYSNLYGNDDEEKEHFFHLWSRLPNLQISQEVLNEEEKPEKFWKMLLEYRTKNGNRLYSGLAQFSLWVLQTPHANAGPERRFSNQNYVKNKFRNKMTVKTVNGTLKLEQAIDYGGGVEFDGSDLMIDLALDGKFYETKKKINYD